MINIEIDKKSSTPLYVQIRDCLRTAIREGALQTGDRLPAVAAFAKEVGVTQATIRRAIEDLTKAGYTRCHVGRGTFISDPESAPVKEEPKQDLKGQNDKPESPEFKYATLNLRNSLRKGLCDLMALGKRPGIIQFTSGVPDPLLLPDGLLDELVNEALKAGGQGGYLEAGCSEGMRELREEIAMRFSEQGTKISSDHVLITNGSQQAVAIIAELALDEKRHILSETPCFKGLIETFAAIGHKVDFVPRDVEGPIPHLLNKYRDDKPYLFYLCPELHNPMGTDISEKRVKIVADWAKKKNNLLVADEIFHDTRFEGSPPESMLTAAGEDRAVVISSLSKSFTTGLRVGWLISSPERIRSLVSFKRVMDQACPPLMQGIALALFRSGKYEAHLKRIRNIYRERRDVMIDALNRRMPSDVTWTVPKGSFSLWLELPPGYSSIGLFLAAVENGVSFLPGPIFNIDNSYINAFRLTYSSTDPDQIKKGIDLLAGTIEKWLRNSGDSALRSDLEYF